MGPLRDPGIKVSGDEDVRMKEGKFEVVLGVKEYWVVWSGFLLLTNFYSLNISKNRSQLTWMLLEFGF